MTKITLEWVLVKRKFQLRGKKAKMAEKIPNPKRKNQAAK